MKKIFAFAAAVIAAMSINAQEPVVKSMDELANFVDFQAAGITSSTTVPTSVESTWFTFDNGTVCKGFLKSDGTEAANSWNVKESYNTGMPAPELADIDTIKAGTMFRAASGSSIVLGAFITNAPGKIHVYFQPNGDSDRGVKIEVLGYPAPVECQKSGVKIGGIRPVYDATFDIDPDTYGAGDVTITLIGNTSNIFGVGIDNLQEKTGVAELSATKAVKTVENGQLVIYRGGKKFNAAGARF